MVMAGPPCGRHWHRVLVGTQPDLMGRSLTEEDFSALTWIKQYVVWRKRREQPMGNSMSKVRIEKKHLHFNVLVVTTVILSNHMK